MKLAVGRCPETGEPLASQPSISRLENSPSKTEAARLALAMVDQFCATVMPGKVEMFDIDDTFVAAHGSQQLAFWNAHHDERGFATLSLTRFDPLVLTMPVIDAHLLKKLLDDDN
jgi:hypothetical protein